MMSLILSAVLAAATTCATAPASATPGELHRQWILQGWERHEGDPPFRFHEKLGRFYSTGSDLHIYDSFDPQHRVARSAEDYRRAWEATFDGLKSARHAVTDEPNVLMLGDGFASTTLEFVARLETPAGKVTGARARSAMVWRCEEGAWRIVREQNAVREVPAADVDAVLSPRRCDQLCER